MNNVERENVLNRIENEGFDYTFTSYSEFKEIKDKEFHKLRKAYVKAAKELAEYLGVEE